MLEEAQKVYKYEVIIIKRVYKGRKTDRHEFNKNKN
jgi:hypothetical protein